MRGWGSRHAPKKSPVREVSFLCSAGGIPGIPPCSTGVTRFTLLTEGAGATPLQWCWQLIRKQLLTPSYTLGPPLLDPESSLWSCRGQCDGRRWTQGKITLNRLGASFLCRSETTLHMKIVLVWQSYIDLLL